MILQRIREAERDMMYEEYRDRVGELITGIVQQSDSRYTLVQLRERVEALLPKSEQVEGERYDHSQRIKAVIKEVSPSTKGPAIIVSRRDPELIKKLFELEVPEIADGLVEIANVAREPGYRSKIAVISHTDGVDPVGACVGPRGSRVRMVVSELRGEKIDIIPFNDEPARFVAKALSPARVREVLVDDEAKQATVIVPDDQLSLAIGREGQNARLAARLTGWRVDIRSETEFAAEEAEHGYEEEEVQGRCAAILSNGRRCPNASLPSSRYCGLESHQALAEHRQRQHRRPRLRGRRRGRRREAAPPTASPRPPRPREPLVERGAARRRRAAAARAGAGDRGAGDIGLDPASGPRVPAAPLRRLRADRAKVRAAAHRRRRRRRRHGARAVADRDGTMPGRGAYLCRGGDRATPAGDVPGRRDAARRDRTRAARGGDLRPQARRIGESMSKKRVHEIAKEQGLSSKELLEKLNAAGVEAKAAASSVEEAAALKALGADGASAPGELQRRAAPAASSARRTAAAACSRRRRATARRPPRRRARRGQGGARGAAAAAGSPPRPRPSQPRAAADERRRPAPGSQPPRPTASAPPASASARRATRAPASARPATSAPAAAGAS